MASNGETGRRLGAIPWRIVGWGTAVLLLLLPWIANAPWTASDFLFAGVLFGSVGLAFEAIVRKSESRSYRFGAALAAITAFLTIWVNGAVGMIGSERNPYNLWFGAVLLIALVGAVVVRFEPAGMVRAMIATAIAQGAVSAFGLPTDLRGAVCSMAFVAPWLLAAVLFRNAPRMSAAS